MQNFIEIHQRNLPPRLDRGIERPRLDRVKVGTEFIKIFFKSLFPSLSVIISSKGGFPVMAETTRNHIFSKEVSQVIIAAMVLAPNFY